MNYKTLLRHLAQLKSFNLLLHIFVTRNPKCRGKHQIAQKKTLKSEIKKNKINSLKLYIDTVECVVSSQWLGVLYKRNGIETFPLFGIARKEPSIRAVRLLCMSVCVCVLSSLIVIYLYKWYLLLLFFLRIIPFLLLRLRL